MNLINIRCLYILTIFLISFGTCASDEITGTSSEYTVSTGDVLNINVYDEPDLSTKSNRVSSSGNITLPLVGKLYVKGFNLSKIENEIVKLYKGDYLKNPSVSVQIEEYRPFYINGYVNKPGGYAYRENLTIQRAITIAGGFHERASKSSIFIEREGSNGKRESVDLNTKVNPGDVVTIEESFF